MDHVALYVGKKNYVKIEIKFYFARILPTLSSIFIIYVGVCVGICRMPTSISKITIVAEKDWNMGEVCDPAQTLFINPFHPMHFRKLYENNKVNWNFYFHTFLWCFKSFYEDLEGLYKTFWGTTKKCENKNLNSCSLFVRDRDGKG